MVKWLRFVGPLVNECLYFLLKETLMFWGKGVFVGRNVWWGWGELKTVTLAYDGEDTVT